MELQVAGREFIIPLSGAQHEVQISGLLPKSRYTYRVVAGKTTTRPYAFHTAGGTKFEFATMVDSREGVGGGASNMAGTNADTQTAYYNLPHSTS